MKHIPLSKSSLILLIIFVVAIVLRLYHYDDHPFWFDELTTNRFSAQNIKTAAALEGESPGHYLLNKIILDTHSPLYYLLIYHYSKVFSEEAPIRLISVLFSILALIIFYRLLRLFLKPTASQLALFIMAIHPFHIWYAQEARVYAVASFFTLLMIYIVMKAFQTHKNSYWMFFPVSVLFALGCSYFAVFLYIATGIAIIFKEYRSEGKKWLASTLFLLLILLLFKTSTFSKLSIVKNRFWLTEPTRASLLGTWKVFTLGYAATDWQVKIAVAVSTFLFVVGADDWFKKDAKNAALFLLLLFLPLFGVFLVSKFIMPVYINKQFLILLPFFITFIVWGIEAFPSIRAKQFFSIVVILCLLAAYKQNDRSCVPCHMSQVDLMGGSYPHFDYESAMDQIELEYQQGDALVTADIQGHDILYSWILEQHRHKNRNLSQDFHFYFFPRHFESDRSPYIKYYLNLTTLIEKTVNPYPLKYSGSKTAFAGDEIDLSSLVSSETNLARPIFQDMFKDKMDIIENLSGPADTQIVVDRAMNKHIKDMTTNQLYFDVINMLPPPEYRDSWQYRNYVEVKDKMLAVDQGILTQKDILKIKANILRLLDPYLFFLTENTLFYITPLQKGFYQIKEEQLATERPARIWFISASWYKDQEPSENIRDVRNYLLKFYTAKLKTKNSHMSLELLTRKTQEEIEAEIAAEQEKHPNEFQYGYSPSEILMH